ncbi:MAG: alcohol dehydrogenase [Linnemannia gamsii]|nr:MAG: alcohol dehydrogenase [Linnemannia gamsii]
MKAIIVEKTNFEPTYHNAKLVNIPKPELTEDGQALLDIHAVAFNHREHFIRTGVYPVIVFGSVMGADGVGRIAEVKGNSSKHKVGDRVVVMPSVGWTKDPRGPEDDYFIIGGGPAPVFSEHFVAQLDDLFKAPDHLTDAEAAALPLAGLTAWRAVFTKGQVREGQNVLITGIGGGVAMLALLFCVAAGANVYVNSSDDAKILKAIELGARGGVNYKADQWDSQLQNLTHGEPFDVVIDGAGGDGFQAFSKLLRMGGIIVSYGMTVHFEVNYSMVAVLRNIEVRGSTMGSRFEFGEMVDFVAKHKIKPVVSQVWSGLESAEEAFNVIKAGSQFGKLVLSLKDDSKL